VPGTSSYNDGVLNVKIDIGNGKILGTKEVSSNGQISGFTEYAGREVLVVLPEEDTNVEPDARRVVEEVKLASREHMAHAFEEYEDAKKRFSGPGEATREFLDDHAPRSFQGLYDRIEGWLQDQVGQAEDRVREAIDADGSTSDEAEAATAEAPRSTEGSA